MRTCSRAQSLGASGALAKAEKAPTFPVKPVERPEAKGGDLCQADDGELATTRFPNATSFTIDN